MALKSMFNKDGSVRGYSYLYKNTGSKSSKGSKRDLDKQVNNLRTRLNAVGADMDNRNFIQKALNLREGSGFLEGFGDVLERASGLASIKAAIAGDPTKSAGQNALDALLGNQRYTGTDVLDALNPDFKNASGVGRFIGGMATDILLDPATYLSLGAGAIAKGATTKGAKALGMLDDAGRLAAGASTKTLKATLKSTKTAEEAAKLVKGADTAQDLLSASKAFRTADVLDTIANPIKLVGKGAKKGGEAAMKALDKFAPEKATALRELGKQAKQVFDYKGFLKKSLGDDGYKSYDNAKQVSDMSRDLTARGTAKQQNLIEKMVRNIKKDPNRIWELTSNVDGSKSTFSFKGMSDDEIFKNINEFIQNEIYFDRPKTIGEDTIRSLIQNKGRAALAIQDFKDPEEANKLLEALQKAVPDPDKVSIERYIQPDTGKATGFIIDIGSNEANSKNVKALEKYLRGFEDDIAKQQLKVDKGGRGLEQAMEQLQALTEKQGDVNELLRPREIVPYEKPKINIPEMEEVAKIQREMTDMDLGIRHAGNVEFKNIDKYEQYMHKSLTKEAQDYIAKNKLKRSPDITYMTLGTDKIPSQTYYTNLYGNFSPSEVNTMIGKDIFDNSLIVSNANKVKSLNRRADNFALTKAVFSGDNDLIKPVTKDMPLEDFTKLRDAGYEMIQGNKVAERLNLADMLDPEDYNRISKTLKGKQFYISKDAIDIMQKNKKLFEQTNNAFYKELNKYMKYWKGGNLLSVGYHLRNVFGAQTNMALAGMSPAEIPAYFSKAGLDVNKYNTKLLPQFEKWLTDPDNARLFKTGSLDDVARAFGNTVGEGDAELFKELFQAQLDGVWGGNTSQMSAVKRAVGEMSKSKLGKVADKIQDINYKLGATTDDINRLAAYRWAQQPKNLSKLTKVGAENAADFVNYAMFDFKSMSPTEQVYFSKMFPFYNFIKNNLAFQFKNVANNGMRYKRLSQAYKNLYSAQELTDKDVMEYVKDQMYIPVKTSSGNIKVIKIGAPIADAANLLTLKGILGASNPLIQYLTDRAYNQDLYTGKKLSSDRTFNTQELTDLLPYGRTIRTTVTNPLNSLYPVSTTSKESANNANAYQELLELQEAAQRYKKETGNSLPTLKELGLDSKSKKKK